MSKKLVSIFSCFILLTVITLIGQTIASAQTKKERQQAIQLVNQADRYFNQKDYRSAADTYGQSIRLVPNNGYAHFWKGYAHYNLKENDAALSEFAIALTQGFKPLQPVARAVIHDIWCHDMSALRNGFRQRGDGRHA